MIPTVILYSPEGYKNLSSKIKCKICNGCGPKGLGGWIVPDTLWGVSVEEACNIHDYMYSVGKTLEDKKESDRVFLNNMVRIADASTTWGWLRRLRRRRAKTYYEAVKMFGGPAFWKGKNKPENLMEV